MVLIFSLLVHKSLDEQAISQLPSIIMLILSLAY